MFYTNNDKDYDSVSLMIMSEVSCHGDWDRKVVQVEYISSIFCH